MKNEKLGFTWGQGFQIASGIENWALDLFGGNSNKSTGYYYDDYKVTGNTPQNNTSTIENQNSAENKVGDTTLESKSKGSNQTIIVILAISGIALLTISILARRKRSGAKHKGL
jgi:hypothetical protein